VTTAALHSLLANDIPLVLLSGSGRALGRLEPPGAPHVAARTRQLDLHRDPATRLALARAMVSAKIHNQAVLLRRRARRSGDPDAVWTVVGRLAELEQAAARAVSVPGLMGIEGAAAGGYFGALRHLVVPGYGFVRRDRAAGDVVNALINYCSALLRETVLSAILAAGLDPYLSFLHTPRRGRPTLAFDLMEEWRPVLLESTVLALLRLGTITPADLAPGEALRDDPTSINPPAADPARERLWLTSSATAAAVARLHARLAAPARGWPEPPERASYADLIGRQALRLRGFLLGDDPAGYQAFRWR
jgi:CRISPR-associated protein Cas1